MNPVSYIKANTPFNSSTNGVKLLQAYYDLSQKQGEELALYALKQDAGWAGSQMLSNLSCLKPEALSAIYDHLVAQVKQANFKLHPIVFRDADTPTRDYLFQLLVSATEVELDYCDRWLQILTWIGCEFVQASFHKWIYYKYPDWHVHLPIAIENYPALAGWELKEIRPQGNVYRHDLYYSQSYSLDWINAETSVDLELCGLCGENLHPLFELDLRNPELSFLKLAGNKLTIAVCSHCTLAKTLYTEIDYDGNYSWSKYNLPSHKKTAVQDFLTNQTSFGAWPSKKLELGQLRASGFEAVASIPIIKSQVGGFPTWLANSDFKKCPRCKLGMRFIAQFSQQERGDNMIYGFLCEDCRIAASFSHFL